MRGSLELLPVIRPPCNFRLFSRADWRGGGGLAVLYSTYMLSGTVLCLNKYVM